MLARCGYATATTVLCAVLATLEVWVILGLSRRWRSICLLLILGPQLVSSVVRLLGWTILFSGNGVLNTILRAIGLGSDTGTLLFTSTGVIIASVHLLLPYVVLSIWLSLQELDPATIDAARSLGASKVTIFRRIFLPEAVPGIFSGIWIAFALTASAFTTPAIIGGRSFKVMSTQIYDEFTASLDWPLGSALAIILLLGTLAIMVLWKRLIEKGYSGAVR